MRVVAYLCFIGTPPPHRANGCLSSTRQRRGRAWEGCCLQQCLQEASPICQAHFLRVSFGAAPFTFLSQAPSPLSKEFAALFLHQQNFTSLCPAPIPMFCISASGKPLLTHTQNKTANWARTTSRLGPLLSSGEAFLPLRQVCFLLKWCRNSF